MFSILVVCRKILFHFVHLILKLFLCIYFEQQHCTSHETNFNHGILHLNSFKFYLYKKYLHTYAFMHKKNLYTCIKIKYDSMNIILTRNCENMLNDVLYKTNFLDLKAQKLVQSFNIGKRLINSRPPAMIMKHRMSQQ